jgi:hypothetical protein
MLAPPGRLCFAILIQLIIFPDSWRFVAFQRGSVIFFAVACRSATLVLSQYSPSTEAQHPPSRKFPGYCQPGHCQQQQQRLRPVVLFGEQGLLGLVEGGLFMPLSGLRATPA